MIGSNVFFGQTILKIHILVLRTPNKMQADYFALCVNKGTAAISATRVYITGKVWLVDTGFDDFAKSDPQVVPCGILIGFNIISLLVPDTTNSL